MIKTRYLSADIRKDLKSKMVFVGGARQVGTTTLALSFLNPPSARHPAYLNWDIPSHKEKIIRHQLPLKHKRVVFDEIHKFAQWRGLMKGLYDEYGKTRSFLVTGSARLDYFSKGGDSLLGRYHYYRLHPFSLFEINKKPSRSDLNQLLNFGGFPEPFLKQSKVYSKRWVRERRQKVVHEDLRDLSQVREVSLIYLLVENLYMVFRVSPYGTQKIRAVKKEQKLYFFDWSPVPDKSIRFENLVACNLLKYCHYHEDVAGDDMELRFIRDTDKREVDFVVLKNNKPLFGVECKTGDSHLSHTIKYFKQRTRIPLWFQVHTGFKDYGDEKKSGRVLPFITFCTEYLKV